jgi:hypothetical protein
MLLSNIEIIDEILWFTEEAEKRKESRNFGKNSFLKPSIIGSLRAKQNFF